MFIRKVLFCLVVLFGLLGHLPSKAQMLYGNRFNEQLYTRARIQYSHPGGFIVDSTAPTFKEDIVYQELKWHGIWHAASLADTNGNILFHTKEVFSLGKKRVLFDRQGLVSGGRDIAPCIECKTSRGAPTQFCGAVIVPYMDKHIVLTQAYDTSINIFPPSSYNTDNYSYLNSVGIWVAIVSDSAVGYHSIDTVFNIYNRKPIRTPNLQVVKHANGRDYWLFFIDIYERKWKKVLLEPSFSFPISDASLPFHGISGNLNREVITPPATTYQGEHVALYNSYRDSIYLFDIDRCTGTISHNFSFQNPMRGKGVSPMDGLMFSWGFTFMENPKILVLCDNKIKTGVIRINYALKSAELLVLADSLFFRQLYKSYWVNTGSGPVLSEIFFIASQHSLAPDGRVYLFVAYPSNYANHGLPFSVSYFEPDADSVRYVIPGVSVNNLYQTTNPNKWFSIAPTQIFYNPVLGPISGTACDSLMQLEPEVKDLDPPIRQRPYIPPPPPPPPPVTPVLQIPNVFTPNGDGINDKLEIRGLPPGPNRLQLYNRWGQLLYENQAYDNTWPPDHDLPATGTYYLELTTAKGEKHRQLLRVVR